MVLSPDNGPMLHLQKLSLADFLPAVEGTKVGLTLPFGTLLPGEFHVLQAEWGFSFGTAQVQQNIVHIICTVFVIGNL